MLDREGSWRKMSTVMALRSRTGKGFVRLLTLVLLAGGAGCAAVGTTDLKVLAPARLDNTLSITVASIRDVSEEKLGSSMFGQEKKEFDISEAAELKVGNLFQDCKCFSKVRVIPHREIPDDATEMTCISMGRKEGTDLVVHGEVNHRASFNLNWLTWLSYIPGIAIGAPLWFPNYTLKAEVELTLHVVDTQNCERIFTRKFTEIAHTSICFLTRVTALADRYMDLEKNIGLHNVAIEAVNSLVRELSSYEPSRAKETPAVQGKAIAVLDLDAEGASVRRMNLGKTAADMFTTAFHKAGIFRVIERRRIRHMLAEREFSMTDMVQPRKGGEIAKVLSIDYLLVGSIAQVGARLVINAQLLDTTTWEMLLSDSDSTSRNEDMQILIENITRRIASRFLEVQRPAEK